MYNKVKILPFKDVNGNTIYNGDTVLYNESAYLVEFVEKENNSWMLIPCNNNLSLECIKLNDDTEYNLTVIFNN